MIALMLRWPLSLLLLLAAAGCGTAPSNDKALMSDSSGSAAILERIGLTLPPSAKIEYTDYAAGMDDAARVLLVMSEADWTIFLEQLVRRAPRPPYFSADANFRLGMAKPGWNPAAAPDLKVGQLAWNNETEGLNIGYSPAGAGKVRVFLFWHQT